MIVGIGLDMIEIERVGNAIKKKRFLERFYTPLEREYLMDRGRGMAKTAAGYFAAKEAVAKSLGTGFSGFKWQDIEIVKTDRGQPQVHLQGGAERLANELNISNIFLSISHCNEYAIAQAIAVNGTENNRRDRKG